ncbi:cytidylyltransferase domain-containing protein [Chloroflexota bacterium]
MKSRIVAIIPARGGSKGIARKNIRLLHGKPLIYYAIKEALSSKYIQRTLVSTEDREIAEITSGFGAEVISRPMELAQDDTLSLHVYQQVIKHLEQAENFSPDIVVALQPTSPLRKAKDIDEAIEKFLGAGCDSVVSVCEVEHPPHWMYTLEEDRMKTVIEGGERITRRQDAPQVYRLNGAVYVLSRNVIMEQNMVLGGDMRAYIMPSKRSVDLDTELDFKFVELLMKEKESG